MEYLKNIKEKLSGKYGYMGIIHSEGGDLIIAHKPDVAPKAYLHEFYRPLNESEINQLEISIMMKIPASYKSLLKECNGMIFFVDTLSLNGLRSNNDRLLIGNWQPYDLSTANRKDKERIKDAKDSLFFIGRFDWDGSKIYIDSDDGKVYRCSRKTSKPLNQWKDLQDFIESEVERLMSIYDEKGDEKDAEKNTCPDPVAL